MTLSLAELSDLVGRFAHAGPRPRVVAHPVVAQWLREAIPCPSPFSYFDLTAFTGIEVTEDESLAWGAWEIREGDEVKSSGVLMLRPGSAA